MELPLDKYRIRIDELEEEKARAEDLVVQERIKAEEEISKVEEEKARAEEEIRKQIKRAIEQKPAAHCFEEPGAITEAHQMAQIGG